MNYIKKYKLFESVNDIDNDIENIMYDITDSGKYKYLSRKVNEKERVIVITELNNKVFYWDFDLIDVIGRTVSYFTSNDFHCFIVYDNIILLMQLK